MVDGMEKIDIRLPEWTKGKRKRNGMWNGIFYIVYSGMVKIWNGNGLEKLSLCVQSGMQ